jgi:hypothetical protein
MMMMDVSEVQQQVSTGAQVIAVAQADKGLSKKEIKKEDKKKVKELKKEEKRKLKVAASEAKKEAKRAKKREREGSKAGKAGAAAAAAAVGAAVDAGAADDDDDDDDDEEVDDDLFEEEEDDDSDEPPGKKARIEDPDALPPPPPSRATAAGRGGGGGMALLTQAFDLGSDAMMTDGNNNSNLGGSGGMALNQGLSPQYSDPLPPECEAVLQQDNKLTPQDRASIIEFFSIEATTGSEEVKRFKLNEDRIVNPDGVVSKDTLYVELDYQTKEFKMLKKSKTA